MKYLLIGSLKIDVDMKLGEFLDYLKNNNISYHCSYFYFAGHQWIHLNDEYIIGDERCKNIRFDFMGIKPNSKLNYIKYEFLNNLGCWIDGRCYKRPFYRGGSIC